MTFQAIDIHKSFENTDVLKGVSLNVEAGESWLCWALPARARRRF